MLNKKWLCWHLLSIHHSLPVWTRTQNFHSCVLFYHPKNIVKNLYSSITKFPKENQNLLNHPWWSTSYSWITSCNSSPVKALQRRYPKKHSLRTTAGHLGREWHPPISKGKSVNHKKLGMLLINIYWESTKIKKSQVLVTQIWLLSGLLELNMSILKHSYIQLPKWWKGSYLYFDHREYFLYQTL